MRAATGFFLFLGALPLVIYPFVLLANVMGLAGHRSGNEPFALVLLSYAFYLGTTAYPVVYLVCAGFAIVGAIRKGKIALGFAFAPIGYLLLLVGLGAIWSFAETGISTLQEQQTQDNASQIAKCAPSGLVNGGDGLRTTGCGVLEPGGTGTGVIANPLEAHNWEFKVTSRYRMTITLKNDKKSCPEIRILDSSGGTATGFEERKPPTCVEGAITTSFFNFNPSGNGTYIIRVFAPKTPGRYLLKIQ